MASLSFMAMDDQQFAERLILGNMQADYVRHGLRWDSEQFAKSWPETHNYTLQSGKQTVGLLRMRIQAELCYLIDLQVVDPWRSQGIGTAALDEVFHRAREAGCSSLRLKAFADSSAVRLYIQKGLQVVKQEGALLFMEARL